MQPTKAFLLHFEIHSFSNSLEKDKLNWIGKQQKQGKSLENNETNLESSGVTCQKSWEQHKIFEHKEQQNQHSRN